jgi:hypothetical protein
VKEIIETDGVISRNEQVAVTYLLRNSERSHGLRPVLPDKFLRIVEHVENVHFFWHLNAKDNGAQLIIRVAFKLTQQIRTTVEKMNEELTKLLPGGFFKGGSDGPNAAENAQVCEDIFHLLGDF